MEFAIMTKIKTTKTTQTQAQSDFVTPLEAQAILDASLDMLDALECLVIYQGDIGPEDFTLDVWKKAMAAVKKAGGIDYSKVEE
jgi:hypothetical protein